MSLSEEDRNKLIHDWHIIFRKGTDFDSWGQPVEAIETYKK